MVCKINRGCAAYAVGLPFALVLGQHDYGPMIGLCQSLANYSTYRHKARQIISMLPIRSSATDLKIHADLRNERANGGYVITGFGPKHQGRGRFIRIARRTVTGIDSWTTRVGSEGASDLRSAR